MAVVPRQFTRLILATSLPLVALACSEPTPMAPVETNNLAVAAAAPATAGEFLGEERASPSIGVTGDFRPGAPLVVSSELRANHPSAQTSYAIFALDEEDEAKPGSLRAPRRLDQFLGNLGRGASKQLSGTVRFAKPGYYRLLVIASGRPATRADRDREGGTVIDQSERTIWLVIDDAGGRLTDGYDSTVVASRTPMFGAYGPFLKSATGSVVSQSAGSNLTTAVAAISGRVWYRNYDPGPDSLTLSPVQDALINAVCYDFNDRPTTTSRTTRTDATGFFSVQCLSNHAGARVSWYFNNSYADVKGPVGASAGGNAVKMSNGSYRDLLSINDYAARVYLRLSQYIPIGNIRFGQSRGPILAWASNLPTDTTTNYVNTYDRIDYGSRRVFGFDGEFVVLHEYGHAFHQLAIEAHTPGSLACPPSGHPIGNVTTFVCAFIEAFADLYAVWLAGARLPPSAFYSSATLENNTFRTVGDGAKVQGAVGAFLLDLVDDVSDPDGVTGDDDGVTYPATYLANIMRTCRFDFPPQLIIQTIDRFVYCAERNLGAASGTPFGNWQTFGYFEEYATEPSSGTPRYNWNPTSIRALWRYDLFNLGSLP